MRVRGSPRSPRITISSHAMRLRLVYRGSSDKKIEMTGEKKKPRGRRKYSRGH